MINWSELPTRGFNTASKSATDALEFARKNPRTAGVAVVGAGGLIILAAPAIVVTLAIGILNLAGFGSGGIVAGSAPASAQAVIGNVGASSAFATLTSAGAGGYGIAAFTGGAQVAGGAILGSAGVAAVLAKMKGGHIEKEESDEEGKLLEKQEYLQVLQSTL